MIPCFDKVKKKKKKENSCGAFKAGASVVNGIFFIYFFYRLKVCKLFGY